MGKLDDKVAIVTGATSGMGKQIAALMAREGARLVLGGRDRKRGESVLEQIRSERGEAVFVPGDVGNLETNERLVAAAENSFGSLDVLVANAGTLGLGSVTEVAVETWHDTLATNLHAVFYLPRMGIPKMKEKGGTIVINGSIAAHKGFPDHAAYCASKGALVSLVRQVAIDYGPSVRINLLCPGPVDTPLLRDSAKAFPEPQLAVSEAAQRTLRKRLGTPDDVAKAALFLACSDSDWITGAALTVDGGIMAGNG